MNIYLYDWAHRALKRSKTGYTHNQQWEGDWSLIAEIIINLAKEGITAAVRYDGTYAYIYVDTHMFQQR